MRSAARLAALLAFLCGITPAKLWAADFAECAGIIVDENGVPIAAAKITLQSGTFAGAVTVTDVSLQLDTVAVTPPIVTLPVPCEAPKP